MVHQRNIDELPMENIGGTFLQKCPYITKRPLTRVISGKTLLRPLYQRGPPLLPPKFRSNIVGPQILKGKRVHKNIELLNQFLLTKSCNVFRAICSQKCGLSVSQTTIQKEKSVEDRKFSIFSSPHRKPACLS